MFNFGMVSSAVIVTTHGITWTNQAGFTTAFISGNVAYSICWSGTQFVAVGSSGKCATS